MKKQEVLKRYLLFIIGLFFIGLGIALTKKGELGISPISSVANVLSTKFPAMTFGTWLFLSNCLFLLAQILILRRKFPPVQLLQLPLSYLFGYFSDLGLLIVGFVPNNGYVLKLLLVVLGSAVIGFGVALGVVASVMLNPPEAFVKVVAVKYNKEFGNIKILLDSSWVALAIVLSLVFFRGQLIGIREGTVIAAFLVGTFAKLYRKPLEKCLTPLLQGRT